MSSIGWPLARNLIRMNKVANTFGKVRKFANGTPRNHQGWDFEAPIGTPCFAIADGRIEFVSTAGGLGKTVALAFTFEGRRLFAVYSHLSLVEVSPGQAVGKGQQIGRTGDTGNAAGMTGRELHLHFEIRTTPSPSVGLIGRISPLEVFRAIPLDRAILAEAEATRPDAAARETAAAVAMDGSGWEIHIRRRTVQSRDGDIRTVGTYQVFHDGRPASNFRLGGRDVPLAGTTAEPKGPGQNARPATRRNPSRIKEGTYPLATQLGRDYVTFDYNADPDTVIFPLPGIELLGTGSRTEILIHPGKNNFISSVGCINLCTHLDRPSENIDFEGSRRRVIALIEDMKAFCGSDFPGSGGRPIPRATAVVEGEP